MVTLIAALAAVHHTANTDFVTDFEFGNGWADFQYLTDDFMAWHQWVILRPPITIDGMQIGMADTAVEDFDGHVVVAQSTTLKVIRLHMGIGRMGGITYGFHSLSSRDS